MVSFQQCPFCCLKSFSTRKLLKRSYHALGACLSPYKYLLSLKTFFGKVEPSKPRGCSTYTSCCCDEPFAISVALFLNFSLHIQFHYEYTFRFNNWFPNKGFNDCPEIVLLKLLLLFHHGSYLVLVFQSLIDILWFKLWNHTWLIFCFGSCWHTFSWSSMITVLAGRPWVDWMDKLRF